MENYVTGYKTPENIEEQKNYFCRYRFSTSYRLNQILEESLNLTLKRIRAKSREPARRRCRRQIGEAVEGEQKGHLDGKPLGATIGQGRKMPYADLI